jgi:hypothetical protein
VCRVDTRGRDLLGALGVFQKAGPVADARLLG